MKPTSIRLPVAEKFGCSDEDAIVRKSFCVSPVRE
jgi:hypothetical protein